MKIFSFSLLLISLLQLSVFLAPDANCKGDSGMLALSTTPPSSTGFEPGENFVEKMLQAAQAPEDYVVNFQMTTYGKKHETEGGTLYFKKPRLMRIETKEGSRKGSLAILTAKGTVKAKAAGGLGFFVVELSPHNRLLRSANGYPMVDTDFASLALALKTFLSQGKSARVSKPTAIDGLENPVYLLEILHNGALFKRVAVNTKTYLPQMWWDFEDSKLVSYSVWSSYRANLGLGQDVFTIKGAN